MPKGRFVKTAIEAPSNNAPKRHPRTIISKEARLVLKASRQEASDKYQKALHEAYADGEQRIRAIASDNAKSDRRVRNDLHMAPPVSLNSRSKKSPWNAFCWKKSQEKENNGKKGKEVLQDVVQNSKEEYAKLTKEEKEELVHELEKVKATKAKGYYSSARSRVNDVTQTVAVLENEINNLRSRSGIEAILFITRGSTDTPLASVQYTTPGVAQFIETIFKVDSQDFLARMEGFAVQGIKGTADTYKKTVAKRRGDIRAKIIEQLRTITGNNDAQMEWKYYWQKVVARYHVIIEGWPASIPFKNLSAASSPLAELNMLLLSWQDGTTYWKQLTSTEAEKLIDGMKARGEIQEPVPHRPRSDRGKKRKRQGTPTDADDELGNSNATVPGADKHRKRRKAAISAPAIDDGSSGSSGGDD